MMTDKEFGQWTKASALTAAIVAMGLVAAALAQSSQVRPDQEVSKSPEAPGAVERPFERGGSMMGYEIVW
jgi:hypothetical protein